MMIDCYTMRLMADDLREIVEDAIVEQGDDAPAVILALVECARERAGEVLARRIREAAVEVARQYERRAQEVLATLEGAGR